MVKNKFHNPNHACFASSGGLLPKNAWISSLVFPLVSGTAKVQKKMPRTHMPANIQKDPARVSSYWISVKVLVTMNARNQLTNVAIDVAGPDKNKYS